MTTKPIKHLFSGVYGEINDGESRILVFREGWNYGMKGGEILKIYCDRQAFDYVMEEIKLRARDVVVDYEHQSEGYPYVVTNGPVIAAGWINWQTGFEYVDGEGLYVNVQWTDEAANYIRERKYRYFSPAFNCEHESGRIISISSLALTNQPATLQQKPIAAKATGNDNEMTPDIFRELGLPVTADEEDCLAAIKELKKRPAPGDEQMSATSMTENEISVAAAKLLGLEGVTDVESFKTRFKAVADAKHTDGEQLKAMGDQIIAFKSANEQLAKANQETAAKLAEYEQKWKARDENDFISEGMKEGKITKANESIFRTLFSAKGGDEARKALKDAPIIVAVGGKVALTAVADPGNCGSAKEEMEKEVAEAMKANPDMKRDQAWTAVCKKRPDLRQRIVEEANQKTAAA